MTMSHDDPAADPELERRLRTAFAARGARAPELGPTPPARRAAHESMAPRRRLALIVAVAAVVLAAIIVPILATRHGDERVRTTPADEVNDAAHQFVLATGYESLGSYRPDAVAELFPRPVHMVEPYLIGAPQVLDSPTDPSTLVVVLPALYVSPPINPEHEIPHGDLVFSGSITPSATLLVSSRVTIAATGASEATIRSLIDGIEAPSTEQHVTIDPVPRGLRLLGSALASEQRLHFRHASSCFQVAVSPSAYDSVTRLGRGFTSTTITTADGRTAHEIASASDDLPVFAWVASGRLMVASLAPCTLGGDVFVGSTTDIEHFVSQVHAVSRHAYMASQPASVVTDAHRVEAIATMLSTHHLPLPSPAPSARWIAEHTTSTMRPALTEEITEMLYCGWVHDRSLDSTTVTDERANAIQSAIQRLADDNGIAGFADEPIPPIEKNDIVELADGRCWQYYLTHPDVAPYSTTTTTTR